MTDRIETDSLGDVKVPADKLYGAQTQRSIENFCACADVMPLKLIHAYALVKKAAALTNLKLGTLSKEKADLIGLACDEIAMGHLDGHFPLVVWQTGSGTQTNMNLNEVISNWCSQKVGRPLGSKDPVHPNDDVNMSQSSNDSFPTAMHVTAVLAIKGELLPHLLHLQKALQKKAEDFAQIVKIGRTHWMDATPLTLGQEFSGYAAQIQEGIEAVKRELPSLRLLAMGGTAVGTGINAPKGFGETFAKTLSEITKELFTSAPNKFAALAAHDPCVSMSGALKRIACSLMKIGGDIRRLASGPRCGIGEITLPANEPGSSIMPGKVNPTQCEALTMAAAQVMGNDVTIGIGGALGHFELNVFKPVIIYNLLQSIRLLGETAEKFTDKCVVGIEPNLERIAEHLDHSLMLATALNTHIGYDKASQIVKKAYKEGLTLKEAALKLKLLTETQFDEIVDPKRMI